jgi:RNA polymerase sigma-70 factor (subfamily 1)
MPPGPDALDAELDGFRDDLLLLARRQVDRRLWDTVDLSGVVQQTLLEAWLAWEQFRRLSEAEKPAWLRRALAANLLDELRKRRAQKRDVRRESSLDEALEASSARLGAWLASEESTPSQKAIRNEQATALDAALARLPGDQRKAVELHLQGRTLAEMARETGKSEAAVAKDVSRGIKKLHALLAESPGDEAGDAP